MDLLKFLNPDAVVEKDASKKADDDDDEKEDVGKSAKAAKSSFDDFDDDDSPMMSRRPTLSDDSDDDDDVIPSSSQKKPVDLDAFMASDTKQEVVEVEEGIGEDDEEEDEEDEDEEDEYETDEDQFEQPYPTAFGPSDELPGETPSQAELRRQKEHNERILREKKKSLINEYLKDMKRLQHLRAKNVFLTLKIQSKARETHETIEKYLKAERDEIERKKEAERLRQLHIQKTCEAQKKKYMKFMMKNKPKEKKKKDKKKSKFFHTRFDGGKAPTTDQKNRQQGQGTLKCTDECNKTAEDVSLKTLEKSHKYDVSIMYGEDLLHSKEKRTGGPKRCSEIRASKVVDKFSFQHSKFLADVAPSSSGTKDYMNITLSSLKAKKSTGESGMKSALRKSVKIGAIGNRKSSLKVVSKRLSYHGLMKGFKTKRRFTVTKEASHFAKSKYKMALAKEIQSHQILLPDDTVDLKHLGHFKFEFMDPRLTAKQVSLKLRYELLSLLKERKIPLHSYKKWPMEIKGVNFTGKNPYGRVLLMYTRLSHTDLEMPNTAYRLALTNIAYLKAKEARMKDCHAKNVLEMKDEKERLEKGCQDILNEIVEGLRIWARVSGSTTLEKRKAREDTEKFIKHLYNVYENFMKKFLIRLYKAITANEYALRKLHISEGKGEGAELHEFKDIMRCADKLKLDHKNAQRLILEYQRHCKSILRTIRFTDRRLRAAQENVDNVSGDLKHMTTQVSSMIEGMYWCMHAARAKQDQETELKANAGILSSPSLFEDYLSIAGKIKDSRERRIQLTRKVQGNLREIYKIIPSRMGA